MSDGSDALNESVLVGQDIAETRKKQRTVYEFEIDNKYEEVEKRKEELRINQSIDLEKDDEERIKKIQADSTGYLTSARESKVFINNDFKGIIPYFNKNLILLAAETGQGKSTISANLAYHALLQGQNVLVITNEENVSDVYNRVSCLCRGWSYTNHENFTDEQIHFFEKNIETLNKRMKVVDDNYSGGLGQTTTIEGIEAIFHSVIKQKTKFDVIIIDYYQNIDRSSKHSGLEDWKVQGMFAKFIDKIKNIIGCPIVLLAQKKRGKKDEDLSYKELIEGRKTISNAATCVAEIKVDKSMFKTIFIIKKSRFANSIGEEVEVGFDKGRYVPWTIEFANQALVRKEEKERNKTMSRVRGEG